MFGPPPILADLTLHPGELYIASEPSILRTILGSCVGVTIWSHRIGAGALCHGVLPRCPFPEAPGANLEEGFRYVDFSIRYMARQFDALGSRRDQLVVKVFGGADVLPASIGVRNKATVGAQNCQVAFDTLAEERLVVAASDVGGPRGRRIHFHTGTGEVLLHRLAAWDDAEKRRRS
jgi:chemotaxis protein CheD